MSSAESAPGRTATDPHAEEAPLDEARVSGIRPGAQVGRFWIIGDLGAGAMGVVYRAFDPDLDRKVALKVVRPRYWGDERAQARALREAQSMARLSHPNVVGVYEVGTYGSALFFAMELVDGVDLREWRRRTNPSWRQTVHVMLQAGRGLAAAHDAGLVHRDVKPSNIVVDGSGRARVTDFGIAAEAPNPTYPPDATSTGERPTPSGSRPAGSPSEPGPSTEDAEGSGSDREDDRVPLSLPKARTVAAPRRIAGTPAYMAPEQMRGTTDARSDQYSFCVTLYEIIHGKRPPRGRDKAVPKWLRNIMARGLQRDPDRRFPSMHALLTELGRDRRARWQRIATAAAGLALVTLSIIGFARTPAGAARVCEGASALMAPVWGDQSLRERIRQAFVATGRPHAQATFERVADRLDAYAAEWVATRTDVCEATRLRGEQSEGLMDLRVQCLDRGIEELRALAALYGSEVDGAAVDSAVRAVGELPAIGDCSDVAALTAVAPMPQSPQTRLAIQELYGRFANARAQGRAGRPAQGIEIARAALNEAEAIGYNPLTAEGYGALGFLQAAAGHADAAELTLERTLSAAAAGGVRRLVAEALITQLRVIGYNLGRHAEALRLKGITEATVTMAGNDPVLRANALHNIGIVYAEDGRPDEAITYYRRALAIREDEFGDSHFEVGASLNNLANALSDRGDQTEAIALYQRALAIYRRALGPEHPAVAQVQNNLALSWLALDQVAEATAAIDASIALWERTLGRNHPEVGRSLLNRSEILQRSGDLEGAAAAAERSVQIKRRAAPNSQPSLAASLSQLGAVYAQMGRGDAALPICREAVEIGAAAMRATHPYRSRHFKCVGLAQAARGDRAAAIGAFERGIALQEDAGDPVELAELSFALAQVVGHNGRGVEAARRARDGLRQRRLRPVLLQEIEAWLNPN